jgi:hypothetical protein
MGSFVANLNTDRKGPGRGILVCLILFAGVSLFVSYGLASTGLREFAVWRTDLRLADAGLRTEGKIEDKRTETASVRAGEPSKGDRRSYWLHYVYTTSAGEHIHGRRNVRQNVYDSFQKGGMVSVRIDPDKPERNLPEFVDVERQYEIGFLGILACISVAITAGIWVLVLLYLRGRIDSQSIMNLFTRDLLGTRIGTKTSVHRAN